MLFCFGRGLGASLVFDLAGGFEEFEGAVVGFLGTFVGFLGVEAALVVAFLGGNLGIFFFCSTIVLYCIILYCFTFWEYESVAGEAVGKSKIG